MTGHAAPGRGTRPTRPTPPARHSQELAWSDGAALIASGLEAALCLRIPWAQAATSEVRRLAVGMCVWLGLDERDRRLVELCATLRDVGMLALPDSVLRPPVTLSSQQRAVVGRHPVIGAEMLDTLAGLESTSAIVRSHHERWDGTGYPDGLAGEATPLLSRVIATADAFVATATEQTRDLPLDADLAHARAPQLRGTQCEPLMVDALLTVLDDRLQRGEAARGRCAHGHVVHLADRGFVRRHRERLTVGDEDRDDGVDGGVSGIGHGQSGLFPSGNGPPVPARAAPLVLALSDCSMPKRAPIADCRRHPRVRVSTQGAPSSAHSSRASISRKEGAGPQSVPQPTAAGHHSRAWPGRQRAAAAGVGRRRSRGMAT